MFASDAQTGVQSIMWRQFYATFIAFQVCSVLGVSMELSENQIIEHLSPYIITD